MEMNFNKEIIKNLTKANVSLRKNQINVNLVIVGGAAFVLQEAVERATFDIDYINTIEDKASYILEVNNINNRVITFEATYGEWKDDLVKIKNITMSNIALYSVSLERLCASRLFSRKRIQDFKESVKNKTFNLNKFEMICEEIYGYCDPVFMNELYENEQDVIGIYKEMG